MPAEHERRRDALRAVLVGEGLDAALVTRLVNVRYLTGFSGSNGAVLVTMDGAVLATDGRYTTQSAEEAPDVERVNERDVAPPLVTLADERGLRRVAVETHDLTVDLFATLRETAPRVGFSSLGQRVEELRAVKDATETDAIRTACAIADRAFTELLDTLRPGRTERDVAIELEARMRAHGADGPSFDTIVGSGPNSAVPHHRPTGRPLGAGELLKLDFGALYAGYHSDMTRTVILGPAAAWQRDLYDLVAAAQRAGCDAVAPYVRGSDVDEASRSVIDAAGHGDGFVHGLGHGVGLEIHEAPALAATSTEVLSEAMVLTVEPGVYLPDRGGVRIEDTLVVPTAGGAPEILTTSPKDLIVV